MKTSENAEPKSPGTVIAEKYRARANAHTDEKRQALLERGIALIYGGKDHAKTAAIRR